MHLWVLDDNVCLCVFQEAVRVVLANLDSLEPFVTKHFNIFPCMLSNSNESCQ